MSLPRLSLAPLWLPPMEGTALLLDLDGTLLDIAPTPDLVRVAPGLAEALRGLRAALGGALAIVTGRPIEQVDGLLAGVPEAVAGEHGGAIRFQPGGDVVRPALPEPPDTWFVEAARAVAAHEGALLERKRRGFVFHFRAVPEAGPALLTVAEAMVAPLSDRFQVMPALMAWEVRPRGADKGSAVAALMATAPFLGRVPIFIGDDVTDEDGMEAARGLGGAGLQVAPWFGSAGGVRAWLGAAAGRGEWPGLPWVAATGG